MYRYLCPLLYICVLFCRYTIVDIQMNDVVPKMLHDALMYVTSLLPHDALLSVTFQPRQNLLTAANKIGEASQDILKQVGDSDDENKAFEVRARKHLLLLVRCVSDVMGALADAAHCANTAAARERHSSLLGYCRNSSMNNQNKCAVDGTRRD